MSKLEYELLCVDNVGKCVVKAEQELCYALMSNSSLFENPRLKHDNTQIEDRDQGLNIQIAKVDPDDEVKDQIGTGFIVRISAQFQFLEPFRLKILSHLKELKFEHIYVLTDEASSNIANDIYPEINKVENSLRRYLIKFLVTKLGPNWWSLTADSEMKKKVINRKNNETNFSSKADSKAYLIDFGELGKIVYSQSSGFISRDDIYTKVMEMDETQEAIAALTIELQSNYNKFFKESFKDQNFQQKWEKLEKIRHKVAHNSLFVETDRITAKELTEDLEKIIRDAEEKIAAVQFSSDDRDAIRDVIASESSLRVISKSEMLSKLRASKRFTDENGYEFMGLKSFVVNYLGPMGYDFKSSYDLIDQLEQEGYLEIYEHHGEGHERSVKAINLKSNSNPPNRVFSGLKDMIETESES